MAQKIRFTTSWDDGSKLDLKVADLLDRYGVKGTFYVPKEFPYQNGKFSKYEHRLSSEEICELSTRHEVGAHTLTHTKLVDLPQDKMEIEVSGSKQWLEHIMGKQVDMFCYPGGKYNLQIIEVVKQAGYKGARTTNKLNFSIPDKKFEMGATLVIAPFPFRKLNGKKLYWRHILDPLKIYGQPLLAFGPRLLFGWQNLADRLLEESAENGYFHLYGHSWELEKYEMWKELGEILKKVSSRSDVEFYTNSQILDL